MVDDDERGPNLHAVGSAAGDEQQASPKRRLRRRGVHLLPNIITTGALFAGFFAIVAAMNGRFVAASLAIYGAFVLDALDGRIARLTGTESEFGAQYDSLSDMVAFGVAPALVAFNLSLEMLGQVGWVVTFVYMACAALRLARFNTGHDNATFTGLASPSAAAIVASTVWIVADTGVQPGVGIAAVTAIITGISALLMVSNFTYFSPKELHLTKRVSPFLALVLVVLVFAFVFADPPKVLLFCFAGYALSAPCRDAWRWLRKRRNQRARASSKQDDTAA